MANWCNLRLAVTGHAADLAPFRRAAGALTGPVYTDRSTVFTPDMEQGEGGDLQAHGLERLAGELRRAVYTFQGRNTDHVDHFRGVSRRYPRLAFVLAVGDPTLPPDYSYLLRKGRQRRWSAPEPLYNELFAKHLRQNGLVPEDAPVDVDTLDFDDPDVDLAYWDAAFELMEVAQAHWDVDVLAWLRALPPAPAPKRSRARRTTRR